MKKKFPFLFLMMHLLLFADISALAVMLYHYDEKRGLLCLIPAIVLAAFCIIYFFI